MFVSFSQKFHWGLYHLSEATVNVEDALLEMRVLNSSCLR